MTIKFYVTEGNDEILTYRGRPVSPLSKDDAPLLREIATFHRVEFVRLDAARCRKGARKPTSPIVTYALGEGAIRAARLYGHLTDTTVAYAEDIDEIVVLGAAVVVTTHSRWTNRLASWCCRVEATTGITPGMLLSSTPSELVATVKNMR
jgi:hypothetical protein